MTRVIQLSVLVLLVTLLVFSSSVSPNAQSPPFFEVNYFDSPYYLDPSLDGVREKLDSSEVEAAYTQALGVAQASSGTPLEATARLVACDALLRQRPLDAGRLQGQTDRVISAFPATGYWLAARIYRIYYVEAPGDLTVEQFQKFDQLITEVGGRPTSQIIDDQPDPAFSETQLPFAYRGHLSQLYREMSYWDSLSVAQRDKLFLFLHQSFPSYQYRHHAREYFRDKLEVNAPSWDGVPPGMPSTPDRTPPRVITQSPGAGTPVAPGAAVEVVLTDGSFWNAQIDPQGTRILVDGLDVTSQLIRQSEINSSSRDADWETLRLSYKPQSPLSLGSHTVQLTAADLGKNTAQSQWTFNVTSQPLTMALQVLSKHVKPRKGEVARVSVQCSRYPVNLKFTIRRGSSTVYQTSVQNQGGTYEFVWDGNASSGQPASNGSHTIEVEASDTAGGRATSSANVEVNNNQ